MKSRAAITLLTLWLGGIVSCPTNRAWAAPPPPQGEVILLPEDGEIPSFEGPGTPAGVDPLGPPLPPITSASPKEIAAVIDDLDHDDAARRDLASRKLIAMGLLARPAVVAALRSPFPEVRARAGEVLRRLPWASPKDPPPVRALLQSYGQMDAGSRCNVVSQLAGLAASISGEALLRILVEDPSDMVRWAVVREIRQRHDDSMLDRIRKLAAAETGPELAACGWAWVASDKNRARALFGRAIGLEQQRRTLDQGEVNELFNHLIGQAIAAGKPDQALGLYRQRFGLDGSPSDASAILVLHADSGPQRGFAGDLQLLADRAAEPEVLYATARVWGRLGFAPAEEACNRVAFALGGASQDQRLEVSNFLLDHNWAQPAERELRAVLKLAGEHKDVCDSNAHFRLATLAARRDDDLAVAQHLEQALAAKDRVENAVVTGHSEEDIREQIYLHYLRAAEKSKQPAEADKWLDKLAAGNGADADVAMDVVALLRDHGRAEAAKQRFERAYDIHAKALAENPQDPGAMNNLAWLCARCGEHLEEALKLASDAIASDPHNAAYLDTAAEANFRVGKKDEAVRLETEALRFRPGDAFMQGQLKRFQEGR